MFHINYQQIVQNLACHILRTFPTYELNPGHSMSLEELINQHYLTKMFILSKLSAKLTPESAPKSVHKSAPKSVPKLTLQTKQTQ